ncbi:MAG: M48 family metallopeptidase [Tepidisphaeraceae bacterium]
MSRLILLLIFAMWMIGESAQLYPHSSARWLIVFFAGYAAMVMGLAVCSRVLARRVDADSLYTSLKWFNRALAIMRGMIPAWFAVGLFGPAAWGRCVASWLTPWINIDVARHDPRQIVQLSLPAIVVGTLPPMLAWLASTWAQYPADRALREQSLLDLLDQNLPVHSPPTMWQYVTAQFRLQILSVVLPILFIVFLRDLAMVLCRVLRINIGNVSDFEGWVLLPSAVLVYILAPKIIQLVLNTRPLGDSPLRRRLEELCGRMNLKYRDILLWQTQYSMGNAAVIGILPRMRYVLLSDLLLETMSDQQIEAVFAHELGHIVYKHMVWYVVFFAILTLASMGLTGGLNAAIPHVPVLRSMSREMLELLVSGSSVLVSVVVLFGFVSRRFERQADVFAARMMQSGWAYGPESASHVGEQGADVFVSALSRVASVNNIPVRARSWCHGSIGSRMDYLREISADPAHTQHFDEAMWRLYAAMVAALIFSAVAAAWAMTAG